MMNARIKRRIGDIELDADKETPCVFVYLHGVYSTRVPQIFISCKHYMAVNELVGDTCDYLLGYDG